MDTHFMPTNDYYQRLLAETDGGARQRLFLDLFVEPWKAMMSMMPGAPAVDDPLAGARRWAWLLPDQTDAIAGALARLEAADAWTIGANALARASARFAPYADRLPMDSVTGWLVLADPDRSNPLERGYTGAVDWSQPRILGQFWDPNDYNLPRLPGLLAHEMHHLLRLRAFPWGPHTSVADYVIIEGMAEAFAASLFGVDTVGYFITEFDPAEFDTARRMIGQGLDRTGFDVIRSYIFGDALAERSGYAPLGGMPTYGGYAIGYHVVQAFLERTGQTIEAATFLPAREVVAGSGFFD
jgi:uncharacterized protein YjaZ